MDKLILNNGVEMPCIGMGTYPMHGATLDAAVAAACRIGYRMFDTADNYYNEADLGQSLAKVYADSDVRRSDIFLISKVSDELYRKGEPGGGKNKGIYFWRTSPVMQQPDAVRRVVRKKLTDSLRQLRTDYLDALLMHWPYPDYLEEIWHEMEDIYREGTVRAIGVCNCRERHLQRLKASGSVMPMINQIETSPLNTKEGVVEYCQASGVQVMVYAPLRVLREVPRYPRLQATLTDLAKKYDKSVQQVLLRYNIERGMAPVAKSESESRQRSNYDVFDFALTPSEMAQLMSYNENLQYLPESKSCPGL